MQDRKTRLAEQLDAKRLDKIVITGFDSDSQCPRSHKEKEDWAWRQGARAIKNIELEYGKSNANSKLLGRPARKLSLEIQMERLGAVR